MMKKGSRETQSADSSPRLYVPKQLARIGPPTLGDSTSHQDKISHEPIAITSMLT